MKPHATRLVGLCVVLAACGALATWFLAGSGVRRSAAHPSVADSSAAIASSAELASGRLLGDVARVDPRRDALAGAVDASHSQRPGVATVSWNGRVIWPEGTPADERGTIRVLTALAERTSAGEQDGVDSDAVVVATAEIDAEGHFRVDVPLAGKRWIELEARYSYFQRPLALPEVAPEALTLRPRLGAWVVGRIAAPERAAPLAGEVELVASGSGRDFRRAQEDDRREHTAEFGVDAGFELGGVPAGKYRLLCKSNAAAPYKRDELTLRAGVRHDCVLDLEPGVFLAGIVVDEASEPFVDVEVAALPRNLEGRDDFDMRRAREAMRITRTDAEGRFRLDGAAAGALMLSASGGQLLGDVMLGLHAAPGEAVDQLELVGRRGATLFGKVTWTDGRPAAGSRVAEIVALLEQVNGSWLRTGATERRSTIADSNGSFHIEGLMLDGTYTLAATLDANDTNDAASRVAGRVEVEGLRPEDSPVLLVLEAEPPVVTLVPAARVVIRVSSPGGEPVAGAEVRDVATGRRELTGRTDVGGRIDFEGLDAGRYQFVASAYGYAPSAEVELMLEPGEAEHDVLLELVRSGRIEGTLLDDEGDVAERKVFLTGALSSTGRAEGMLATTDTEGRFVVDDVAPGTWSVMAPPAEKPGALQPSPADLESANVEVVAGETTYVELGTPPAEPIRVSGRVTATGEPVQAKILFVKSGDDLLAGIAEVATDDQGVFSVVLDEPGTYFVSATPHDRNLDHRRTVVITGDTTLDLAIPGGVILGTVRSDGEPYAGVHVRVMLDGPRPSGSLIGSTFLNAATDHAGEYRLEGLAAGTYRVAVGGSSYGMEGATARHVQSGIEVRADRATGGVDFELTEPGTISALVLDRAGKPIGYGALFVHDTEGRVVNPIGISQRSTDGRYEVDGISPGRYRVNFRGTSLVSAASAAIDVVSSETTDVQLVAEEGTQLVVMVVDEVGQPLDARIAVTDADGKEFHGMTTYDLSIGSPNRGWSPGKATFGPLAPGEYEVHVVAGDAESRRKVKLSGQAERKLTVRLR